MIIVRAPMRISFVGGGSDIPEFYEKEMGSVVSVTIDKFVYIVIHPTPLIDKIAVRYSVCESVNNVEDIQHTRVKAALKYFGINSCLEIGSFATLPAKMGLGSSSSFSVALMRGLAAKNGLRWNALKTALSACHLEINLLKEPIGKQDQFAAAFGGLNVYEFHPNEVKVKPVFVDYKYYLDFERHILLFFTGQTREASSVLAHQNIEKNRCIISKMAGRVPEFAENIRYGLFKSAGRLLHENWMDKKKLADNVSNEVVDSLYANGMNAGAWGGKLLGAGNGGCVLFLCDPEKKSAIREVVLKDNIQEIPIKFVRSGVSVLYNHD